jgi:hypothetical protein
MHNMRRLARGSRRLVGVHTPAATQLALLKHEQNAKRGRQCAKLFLKQTTRRRMA